MKGKLRILLAVAISVLIGSSAAAQYEPPAGQQPVPPPPGPDDSVPPPPPDDPPPPVESVTGTPASADGEQPNDERYGVPQEQPKPWEAAGTQNASPPASTSTDNIDTEEEKPESSVSGEFVFGSYGRAQISFDPDGNRGLNQNVTAHGPRLFEASYAELDLSYLIEKEDGFDALVLCTLALFEPMAHYSGFETDQFWAVRNLMAEVGGFIPKLAGLRLWVGSRMYRGDDIYLLDYWPLDNLNTMGGGIIFNQSGFDLRLHVGVNRLEDSYQRQEVQVPGAQFGSATKVLLDRQRLIGSARIGYTFDNLVGDLGFKVLAYGEAHHLPGGKAVPEEVLEDDGDTEYVLEDVVEEVSSDKGFVVGGQLGLFGFGRSSHLNLFVRYASGIAAYGEFAVPFGTNREGTADGAFEVVGGFSANWESHWLGIMLGGYLRRFRDADVNSYDTDDFGEGAIVLRPVVFLTEHFHQGFEVSYQRHAPYGLDPQTNQQEIASVTQLTVMEIISLGRGSYKRPQIRLYYTLGLPNQAARDTYEPGDARRLSKPEHFFGLGAEWWFNSSSYR